MIKLSKILNEGKDEIIFGKPSEKHVKKMNRSFGVFEGFNMTNLYNIPPSPNSSSETLEELFELDKIKPNPDFVRKADNIVEYFIERTSDLDIKKDLKTFIESVIHDSGPIILRLKYHYNRPRPIQVAKMQGLKFHHQPLESAMSPSYPSGHTAQSYLLAYMLSDIYNKYKNRFFKIAEEISVSRNVARQHFISDSEFGKKIGHELWRHYETK
tara:strand:+ start:4787 stop:5425 length:639 start_codon:yes stop_codon:yes gene_type:complete